MPICQLFVKAADLNAQGVVRLPINYHGLYNVQLLSLQYHDTGGAGVSRIIQLVSDDLYLNNSPTPYITFITNPNASITIDSSSKYNFDLLNLRGFIQLQPINIATSTTPVGFTGLVLTIQINEPGK